MKFLIYGGPDELTQSTQDWAKYWAGLGFDGCFLQNNPWYSWDDDVGTDSASTKWQNLLTFRKLYTAAGMTDTFVKASPYRAVDWTTTKIATTFSHAATMAKYCGAGLAIDMEPQANSPTLWTVDPALPNKADLIYNVGIACGNAIASNQPVIPLICLPEVVFYAEAGYPAYALAPHFWKGIRDGKEGRYVGTEATYNAGDPVAAARNVISYYVKSGYTNALATIGLWPLGNTYSDKLARPGYTPAEFQTKVTNCVAYLKQIGSGYLWIYGGWAWQGTGLDSNFQQYADTLLSY